MGFSAIDYAIVIVYLVGITAFGTLFRRTHRTARDYFVGSRNTHWLVISLSIVATETSTLTLIGVPAQAYAAYNPTAGTGAMTFLQVAAGYILARILISLLFVPAYFKGNILTAYELLNRRFGPRAKHAAASLFLLMRVLADGVRVFATSLVVGAVLQSSIPGIPHLWLWSIAAVGVLTLIYTFEGGIAAVIWTDLIQLVIYMAGSLLAAWTLLGLIPGGWTAVVEAGRAAGKFQLLSFSTDLTVPFTFWAGLIGGTCLTMASHGTDQLLVQRLFACRNMRDAQKALVASGFIVFVQFVVFLLVGVMLFAYYQTVPAPRLTTTDEIFPRFIIDHLSGGIGGLVIAAIFAAAMSTLSGSLNSLASTTVIDFYQPLAGNRLDETGMLRLSRWVTVGWGVVLIGVAVVARDWGSVFTAGLSIASLVYGPMLGAFLLGVLTTRVGQTGVITGMTVSLAVMVAVKWLTPLAWTWYVLVGTAVCMAVGTAVSALVERRGQPV